MQQPMLEPFGLAGGTNLALQFGHRLSVDLDLFTNQSFSEQELFDELVLAFPTVIKTDEAKNTLSLFIEGIKVDLLAHRYPLVSPFTENWGTRFWSIEDVIAMKLGAVSGQKRFLGFSRVTKPFLADANAPVFYCKICQQRSWIRRSLANLF